MTKMTHDELVTGVCNLCAALCRGSSQEDLAPLIDKAFGNLKVKRLADVGQLFGATHNTVSGNWRQEGLPGDKDGYPVAEMFKWYAKRHAHNIAQMSASRSTVNEAKEAAGLRKLEADARVAVSRADCLTGDMVSRNEVSSQYRACLIVLREGIMAIPSKVKPFLPREFASDICERIKSVCRLTLEGLGSKSQAELNDLYQEQLN
ncbi:MAG: hypothetical protein O7D91_21335 [Planctomycetota bacterium]|nr:hypothetical protein [Planctomycetota bacterium]